MGTYWRAQCVAPSDKSHGDIYQALAESFGVVVRQMSHFDSTSCLSVFNRSEAGVWCDIPAEFASVIRVALDVAKHSNGAYDPAAGPLIDAYGFGAKSPELQDVTIGAIASSCVKGRWRNLEIASGRDEESLETGFSTKLLQPGGVELNLSSIAKGYAVDLAAERLLALGIKHFLIEIGGELRGHGCKPNGMPWWCNLEKPEDAEGLDDTLVALCGLSIATSGDLVQQRLTQSSERISHIVDPRTGTPADNGLTLVTVLHTSCCLADAWATALFVLGLDQGMEIAESLSLPVLFTQRVGSGYQEHLTSSLSDMLD